MSRSAERCTWCDWLRNPNIPSPRWFWILPSMNHLENPWLGQVRLCYHISISLFGRLVGWSVYFVTSMTFLVKVLDVSPGFYQHPITHPKLCKSSPGDLYHSLTGRQKLRQMTVPKKTNDGEKDWTPVLMYMFLHTCVGKTFGEVSRSQMFSSYDISFH